MNFKEWLFRSENYNKKISYNIYKNPDKAELLETLEKDKKISRAMWDEDYAGNVRGLLVGEDIYIWPENASMHYDMAREYDLNYRVAFYINDWLKLNGSHGDLSNVERNPNYIRMMDGSEATSSPSSFTTRTWKDVMRRPTKVEPGGAFALPYESKIPTIVSPTIR
jgi:hypothetical protein